MLYGKKFLRKVQRTEGKRSSIHQFPEEYDVFFTEDIQDARDFFDDKAMDRNRYKLFEVNNCNREAVF